jgi:hypothetical protein
MVTGNGKLNIFLTPNPNRNCIMQLPYSPYPMTPPTTTRPALHSKQNHHSPMPTRAPQAATIARGQHIKQTLQRLCKIDDLFLNNSITHAKDECTTIAKKDTTNAKCVAINSAHAQCNQPTIKLVQRGCNTVYHLGSAFNWTIKKLSRKKMSVLSSRTRYTYLMPLQPLVSC